MAAPTVYVSNFVGAHDYSAAASYGAVKPITSGGFTVFHTADLMQEIIRGIAYSAPNDYIILSGSGFVSALCVTTWLQMHPVCQTLLWDQKTNSYVVRAIDRQQIRHKIQEQRDKLVEQEAQSL